MGFANSPRESWKELGNGSQPWMQSTGSYYVSLPNVRNGLAKAGQSAQFELHACPSLHTTNQSRNCIFPSAALFLLLSANAAHTLTYLHLRGLCSWPGPGLILSCPFPYSWCSGT